MELLSIQMLHLKDILKMWFCGVRSMEDECDVPTDATVTWQNIGLTHLLTL